MKKSPCRYTELFTFRDQQPLSFSLSYYIVWNWFYSVSCFHQMFHSLCTCRSPLSYLDLDLLSRHVHIQGSHPLQCLAIQIIFASYGNVIKAFKRSQKVKAYISQEGDVLSPSYMGHTHWGGLEHLVETSDKLSTKVVKKENLSSFCIHDWLIGDPQTYTPELKPHLAFPTSVCRTIALRAKLVIKTKLHSTIKFSTL